MFSIAFSSILLLSLTMRRRRVAQCSALRTLSMPPTYLAMSFATRCSSGRSSYAWSAAALCCTFAAAGPVASAAPCDVTLPPPSSTVMSANSAAFVTTTGVVVS